MQEGDESSPPNCRVCVKPLWILSWTGPGQAGEEARGGEEGMSVLWGRCRVSNSGSCGLGLGEPLPCGAGLASCLRAWRSCSLRKTCRCASSSRTGKGWPGQARAPSPSQTCLLHQSPHSHTCHSHRESSTSQTPHVASAQVSHTVSSGL